MTLKLDPNLSDADGFYEALIEAHDGLNTEQSTALNARLIFVLANQIGDKHTLQAAIDTARKAGG